MDLTNIEDAVLEHLQEVAHVKRALLQVAKTIANDYPTEAHVTLTTIRSLTRSADKLLGDTVTGPAP